MRYLVDHDFHIHTQLSSCSNDPAQTCQRIEQYALESGLTSVCLTDHFWDSAVPGTSRWYAPQDFDHIAPTRSYVPSKPKRVKFFFGCETELDRNMTLGISPEVMQKMDFIIIPTTHFHMEGFTVPSGIDISTRAKLYVDRLQAVLDMPLPFEKVGIAHLCCELIAPQGQHIDVLNAVPDEAYAALFAQMAKKGAGVELNFIISHYTGDDLAAMLRPYRIAAKQHCKFYFGSDAHHPNELDAAKNNFERIVDALDLKEDQKFLLPSQRSHE